jgi:transposase
MAEQTFTGGLVEGSFIPPQDIRDLRDLVRYKRKITDQAASEKNRIIKILEDANIKLSSVLTNVDGATGTKIINDLIAGKTDTDGLLMHYHGKMKASKEEVRRALEGRLTKHHQFMLQIIQQSIRDKEALIDALENQIDEAVKAYEVEIDLLQSIPGVGKESAISIISEVGADMDRFPNEKHISSWAGMSPGNNESGGKKKAVKTLHGNKYLQRTLTESGWGATRKKGSYFREKYYRLVSRRGKKKALVAIGHKIIVAAYFIIKNKEEYKEPIQRDNPFSKERMAKSYFKKIEELGFKISENHLVPTL